MYRLAWYHSFKKGFQKTAKSNPSLEEKIFSVLDNLSQNPFDPKLKAHKLHGKLTGLWACKVEHDCRIVFAFEKDPDNDEEIIALIDIGKHDEVY
jgi:addiction module RelE/StbE family toxin